MDQVLCVAGDIQMHLLASSFFSVRGEIVTPASMLLKGDFGWTSEVSLSLVSQGRAAGLTPGSFRSDQARLILIANPCLARVLYEAGL